MIPASIGIDIWKYSAKYFMILNEDTFGYDVRILTRYLSCNQFIFLVNLAIGLFNRSITGL